MSEFGITFSGDTDEDWNDYVRIADGVGFACLGMGDSQSVYTDVYVRLAVAAMRTSAMRIGTWVTNPVTRHPAVTYSAISSIDAMSGGRAYLGIGTGFSAVANLGLPPAKLADLEEYVAAINALQDKGEAQWRGATIRVRKHVRRIPVYIGASGPKALELAGRIGDGAFILNGVTRDIVEDSKSHLAAGAAASGRRLEDIDAWWVVAANLAEDDDTATSEMLGTLASFAGTAFGDGKRVPPEYADKLAALRAQYDMMNHGAHGPSRQAELVRELGLTPYFENRFALCGAPDKFVRMAKAAQDAGAAKLWLTMRTAEKRRFLRLWRDQVAGRLGVTV